jgi:hypothetical protein
VRIEYIIFIVNLAVTLIMCGAIWLTQLSLYPLFASVGKAEFSAYEQEHIRRITPIAWTMIHIELFSSALLLLVRPSEMPFGAAVVGFVFVIWIWYSTKKIQCPLHQALAKGFDQQLHAKLLQSNVHRAVAWTMRGILMLVMLVWIIQP